MGEPGTPDERGHRRLLAGRGDSTPWPTAGQPEEISHTGTNVSERDLDVLLAHPIRLNLDGVSQLERARAPGAGPHRRASASTRAPGAGYTEHLAYAGERPTKFGVTEDRLDDAIAAVRRHGLVVDTLHFHAGLGLAGRPAGRVRGGAGAARPRSSTGCSTRASPIREVNVGGGLGRVARDGERPVDLDAYAQVVARHLGPVRRHRGLRARRPRR